MTKLECEDGLSLCAVGTDTVDHIVKGIIDTVIEGKVRRKVLVIVEYLYLELVYLLKTKEGNLNLILFLYLKTHLLLVFFLSAADIA